MAIFRTLEQCGTPYDRNSFNYILTLAENVDMQKQWTYFLKNSKDDMLGFLVVIEEMQNFFVF